MKAVDVLNDAFGFLMHEGSDEGWRANGHARADQPLHLHGIFGLVVLECEKGSETVELRRVVDDGLNWRSSFVKLYALKVYLAFWEL